ncbi:glycosyltransferase family 2 protein [Methanobrevibacter arboriphilus]|nr:glycosyltransferase family 2 protein [Methanobrevibacter arboriphilus]
MVNYNGENFLEKCFNSIKNQSFQEFEIIFIDNNSIDNSIYFVNRFSEKLSQNIKVLKNKSNLGFSAAVNQGINHSSSEYILLLNNDIELDPNFILNIINCFKSYNNQNSNKNIFSVSSKMIQFNNRDLIDDAGDYYNIMGWTIKKGEGKDEKMYNNSYEIFSSCAGAALYKKSILDKIGLFDENFFAYMEDVDIGYRSLINGFKNVYCPNAIVYHIGSGSSGDKYNEFKIPLAARNNIWVIYKNMPWPQIILNIGFLAIGFLIKYIFFVRKGYGDLYLKGLKEGIKNRNKIKKIEFKRNNLKNYFKIQGRLIINTFKLIYK